MLRRLVKLMKKGSYKNYMSVYINIARDAGAIPILATLSEQTEAFRREP